MDGINMSFIPLLQAAPSASSSGALFSGVVPFILIIVIFYFFLIRPQNKKQKETELAVQEALRREKELEGTVKKQSEAMKFESIQEAQAQAEAIRLEGQAKAEAMRLEGMAKVDIIRETGKAEAEAMLKKAEAFKQYNDAAMAQMIIERLPDIAKAISEPLSKTEKIVIMDGGNNNGGGAAKVTNYVTEIMSKLPETVKATTGIDLIEMLKNTKKEGE